VVLLFWSRGRWRKRKKIERKVVGAEAEAKAQAQQVLIRALAEHENTGTIFEPSTTSLYDYKVFWLNEYVMINLNHNTQENYRGIITPELLQKFINDKYLEGYSRATLTIFHTVLQNALKQAVYPYKLLNENPMQYVKLPKKENKKTTEADLKILPLSSIRKISLFLEPTNTFYIPFHIGLNTGMRVSEVCALNWDCVDLIEGTIAVKKIMVSVNNEWVIQEKLGIDFNFHSLWHTHATLLLEQGAPIKDIQARFGHSRSGITLDTYSHLTDKMKNQTVDIFEKLMTDMK